MRLLLPGCWEASSAASWEAESGPSSLQSTDAFGRNVFSVIPARAVRTWKYGALFLYDLVSGSLFLGVWVLLVEYAIEFFER